MLAVELLNIIVAINTVSLTLLTVELLMIIAALKMNAVRLTLLAVDLLMIIVALTINTVRVADN